MTRTRALTAALITLVLAGCAGGPTVAPGMPCTAQTFTVTDTFHGARRGSCKVLGPDQVRINIRQEDDKVQNKSPWFAFKVDTTTNARVNVVMRYHNATHRYVPKISSDGQQWTPLDASAITLSRNEKEATLVIDSPADRFWVAAQELLLPPYYDAWLSDQAQRLDVRIQTAGLSNRRLPIKFLEISPEQTDVLMLVGRQHPPELTGAFAFEAFAETVFGDSALATQFRRQFRIIAVPLLNPDGVNGGNWRHNLGSTDLNRDWGPFAQPETRSMRDLIDRLEQEGATIRVFSDFHSTKSNLFYTPDLDHPTSPPAFVREWLERSRQRIENYEFTIEDGPVSEQANSKNYMYKRFAIPAVTYEVGDETDRAATQAAARIFAEELMSLMLCQQEQGWETLCGAT